MNIIFLKCIKKSNCIFITALFILIFLFFSVAKAEKVSNIDNFSPSEISIINSKEYNELLISVQEKVEYIK